MFSWLTKKKPKQTNEPPKAMDSLWKPDPNRDGFLLANLKFSDGETYEISFKYNPSETKFEKLIISRESSGENSKLIFPNMEFNNIESKQALPLIQILIKTKENNCKEAEDALFHLVQNEKVTLSEDFEFGKHISTSTIDQSITWFKEAKNVSAKDTFKLIKAVVEEGGENKLDRIYEIADSFKSIEESGRSKIAEVLLKSYGEKAAKHMCDVFLFKDKPCLAKYLKNIDASLFGKLLSGATSIGWNNSNRMGHGLVHALSATPSDERKALVAKLCNELYEKDHFHLLFQVLPSFPHQKRKILRKHGKNFLEVLKEGIPREIGIKIAKMSPARVLCNRELFSGIKDDEILSEALNERYSESAIEDIFIGGYEVSSKLAMKLVSEGNLELIIKHLTIINFNKRDYPKVLKAIADKKKMSVIFENLYDIPEYALEALEKEHALLSFKRDVGIYSKKIYKLYLKAHRLGDQHQKSKFLADLNELKDKLLSPSEVPEHLIKHPLYKPIMEIVYPDNAKIQSKELLFCEDRSEDLKKFKIRESYTIDTYEGCRMMLRDNVEPDKDEREKFEKLIKEAKEDLASVNYDIKKMKALLEEELNGEVKINNVFKTIEERLFGAFLATKRGDLNIDKIKKLLIMYQFIEHENIADYMNASVEKSSKSLNPDYSHLLELHEYYFDKLNDALQSIITKLRDNAKLKTPLLKLHTTLEARRRQEHRLDVINRHQPAKLGWSTSLENIISNIRKKPKKTGGQTNEEIIENILNKEKSKIANFIYDLTGIEAKVEQIELKNFNAGKYLKAYDSQDAKTTDLENVFSYVTENLRSTFSDELESVQNEIAKYVPEEGTKTNKRILRGIITKNTPSGSARRVAGVCVGRDFPRQKGELSQWTDEDYLQMVLVDPKIPRCEGALLMHCYKEKGKKVLTVSFNPSSTYLYNVDQESLFQGLLGQVIEFAKDNNIDMVTCSKNPAIRTNRTGGGFERAMNATIRAIGKVFKLKESRIFSHKPKYTQKDLDVLWTAA